MAEKATKTQYRIRNWNEYDAALKNRGSLTFWVDEEVLAGWLNAQKTGKRGASPFYSDLAIVTMSTMGSPEFGRTPNGRIYGVVIWVDGS